MIIYTYLPAPPAITIYKQYAIKHSGQSLYTKHNQDILFDYLFKTSCTYKDMTH